MNEIRLLIKAFVLLLVMSQFSCTRDNLGGNVKTPQDVTTISFLLDTPLSLLTRGVSTPPENLIESLDILAFSAENSTHEFVYKAVNVQIEDTSTDSIKKVTANVFKRDYPQCFVLIANAKQQLEDLEPLTEGMPKESMLNMIFYSKSNEWTSDNDPFTPIPMWGETSITTIQDVNPDMKTHLLRMAARIDVYMSDEIKTTKLKGLQIHRANSKGYVVPSMSNLISESGENSYKAKAPTLPVDPLKLTNALTYSVNTTTGLLPSVYLFEAEAGTSLEDAPCILVEAIYEGDNFPSYYRLDFASLDKDGIFEAFQPILRNHRYVFNIHSVDGRGYSTAEEALESESYNIGAKLYIWEHGEMAEFVFNSAYVLGVSQKVFNLNKPESVNELLVTTDYPQGWKATVDKNLYPWLTITSDTFTGINQKDPLGFKVIENNTSQTRTGYIEITAGTLKQTITVIQDIESEVYLKVLDEGGIAAQDLLFKRYPGFNSPSQQQVTVSWSPSSSNVSIVHVDHTTAGFHYGSGDNISALNALNGGDHMFNILPAAFTDAEIDANPFLVKASTAQFMLQHGSQTLVENLTLQHVSHDLIAELEDIYYMDGSIQGMIVKSNVSWTADFENRTVVDQMITTAGGNQTDGELVTFRMKNDPDKIIGSGTETIVFHCTTEHGDTFTKKYTINATSDEPPIVGANTYLVKPGGNSVSIPINWANKDGVKRILPTDDVEITFIWTDNPAGMSASGVVRSMEMTKLGVNRELVVTSGNAIGNAVVGVTVGGVLKWSWLIWGTDYDPDNDGRTYSNNGFTAMDRNLGALTDQMDVPGAHGLYFQWARKDPMIYSDRLDLYSGLPNTSSYPVYGKDMNQMYISLNSNSLSDNLELGIQNPLNFYTGTRQVSDIYLWKENDGSKGAQDPCPEGWRLPPNSQTQSLWLNVTRTFNPENDYVTLSNLGNWQLSGNISASSGQANYALIGVYAFMWSNDVSSSHGLRFAVTKTAGIENENGGGLTSASSVRCVKEY